MTKYFLHGLALSAIMTVVTIGWVFLLAVLLSFGSFIGLIIGLMMFVYAIGSINKSLSEIFLGPQNRVGLEDADMARHGPFRGIPQLILNGSPRPDNNDPAVHRLFLHRWFRRKERGGLHLAGSRGLLLKCSDHHRSGNHSHDVS
jgi:hypothetical protein